MTGTRKIVTNRCIGGFALSPEAFSRLRAAGNPTALSFDDGASFQFAKKVDRADPALVRIVEEMGDAANGPEAKLEVTAIPADVHWEILEHDGLECVSEKLRTW